MATLCLGCVLAAGVQQQHRVTLRALSQLQKEMAHQGWSISWSQVHPVFSLWRTDADLTDVRLSGPVTDAYLLRYGCARIRVSASRWHYGRITLRFQGPEALVLSSSSQGAALLALRAVSDGQIADLRPDRQEISIGFPHITTDLESASFLPLSVHYPVSLLMTQATLALHRESPPSALSAEFTARQVTFPRDLTGLGDTLTAIHLAATVTRQSGQTHVQLHLGDGRLGPLALGMAGQATFDPHGNGDFDITMHGLDDTLTHLTQTGTVSPSVAGMARLMTEGRAIPSRQLPDTREAILTVPLRLRNDVWTVGALPAPVLNALVQAGAQSTR